MTIKKCRAVILSPCTGIHQEITQILLDSKTSNASDKLQTLPLMKCLKDNNFTINAYSLNTIYELKEINKIGLADLCIICKMRHNPSKENGDKYAQFHAFNVLTLKRNGAKIITLYSDNVCDSSNTDSELYKNILFLSDYVITPTLALREHASRWTQAQTKFSIINDPGFLKEKSFKLLKKNDKCKLIWFGNNKNLIHLEESLPELIENSPLNYQYIFTVLASNQAIEKFRRDTEPKLPRRRDWKLRYVQWDFNNQPTQFEKELEDAHISFIPSDPLDPLKNGVSHNRLADSIQSGCITIASPMSSYLELSKVCLLGNNFSQLLNLAMEQNHRLCQKYETFRPTLMKRFSPQHNREEWQNFLDQFI